MNDTALKAMKSFWTCSLCSLLAGCGPSKREIAQEALDAKFAERAATQYEDRMNYQRYQMHVAHQGEHNDVIFRFDTRTGKAWLCVDYSTGFHLIDFPVPAN